MTVSPGIIFSALLAVVFWLSTWLQLRTENWTSREGPEPVLKVLFGDGRQILANHMFVEADIYFHSGYYPSIFDQQAAPTNSAHMTQDGEVEHEKAEGHEQSQEDPHEKAMRFLGAPADWIERFGRKFMITTHKHLSGGKEREMLPWLRLSAELDPHRIDTYTVAAYWLRRNLGKPKEAEQFLREGLLANPDSYEILLELGQLYYENRKDFERARNVWEAALLRWVKREGQKEKPDLLGMGQLCMRLAHLEERQGNYARAGKWLELILAKKASPNPGAVEKQLKEIRAKLGQNRLD